MEKFFAEQSSRAFNQLVLIFTGILGLVVFLLYKISQKVQLFGNVFIHQLETACGCTQMTQLAAMHPFITGTLAILSLSILIFAGFLIYKFTRLVRQTSKFHQQYSARTKTNRSAKLRRAISNLGLAGDRIIEIGEDKPMVFCYGMFRPKVCLSSGLIKFLKQDELQAVLLHENQHRRAHDPLKLFVIKFFQNIFSFLPGMKTIVNKYLTYSELAADEQATNNFTDRSKLARALFKITEAEEKNMIRAELAMSFFTSVIEERINKLSDKSYFPQFKIWGKGLALGFFAVILTASATFVFLSDSTKAFTMHSAGNCTHAKIADSSCQLSSTAVCGNQGEIKQQSCAASHYSVDK